MGNDLKQTGKAVCELPATDIHNLEIRCPFGTLDVKRCQTKRTTNRRSKSDASATVPELPHQKASVLGSTIEKINHIFAVLVSTSPILMALIGSILSQLRKLALEARHRRTINNFLR